ncbi:MAG TPA: methylated-DNA--[protein]-cysteine S-methyltransferase [Coleofasciculaceae cyanobacterium]
MNQSAQHIFAIASPVGWWTVTSTDEQVLSIDYHGQTLPTHVKDEPETRLEQRLQCMLSRYFRGEAVDFQPVPVAIPVQPPMVAGVMRVLRTIPRGTVESYQWVADRLGNINATRAVGGALGRNPVPILVPCHRVIAKHGRLGGFMQNHPDGLLIKTFLLGLEGHVIEGGRLFPKRNTVTV